MVVALWAQRWPRMRDRCGGDTVPGNVAVGGCLVHQLPGHLEQKDGEGKKMRFVPAPSSNSASREVAMWLHAP